MSVKEIYEISEGINNKLSSFPLVINFPRRNGARAGKRDGNSTIPNLSVEHHFTRLSQRLSKTLIYKTIFNRRRYIMCTKGYSRS